MMMLFSAAIMSGVNAMGTLCFEIEQNTSGSRISNDFVCITV